MSNRGVVISLIVAILLGLATLALLRTGGASGTGAAGGGGLGSILSGLAGSRGPASVGVGERLLDLAPSSVMEIVVAGIDGRTDTVQRIGSSGVPMGTPAWAKDAEWVLTTAGSPKPAGAAGDSNVWGVAPAQIQGLLRVLGEARAVAAPSSDAKIGERATSVTFKLRDGTSRLLRLSERTLAGTGLVEVHAARQAGNPGANSGKASDGPKLAVANDELHRLFTSPGPRGWRDRSVLTTIASEASRVRLENPAQKLTLGKVEGRWTMREPVAAPIDPHAVNALLTALAGLRIEDFLDDGPSVLPASMGLDKPKGTLVIEADRRTLGPGHADSVKVETAQIEVAIGAPADAQGRRVFSRIDRSRTVLLDGTALQSLTMDPSAYIWASPTRVPAPDIVRMIITANEPGAAASARVYARQDTRWTLQIGAGQPVPLNDSDLSEVEALVGFLTGADQSAPAAAANRPSPAQRPAISLSAPDGLKVHATIKLQGSAGGSGASDAKILEQVDVCTAAPGSLTMQTGPVFRTYPMARAPGLLSRLVDDASPRAPAAQAEPGK